MGRILAFRFLPMSIEEYKKKKQMYKDLLAEHRKRTDDDHRYMYECDECNKADNFLHDWKDDYEHMEHQRVNHDLPYDEIFTYQAMHDLRKQFISEDKHYEISVLSMILDQWPLNKMDNICIFHYD